MALTPEEVVSKEFAQTRYRPGYDQQEVDEFLDEVVAELRRLNAENESLREQLKERGTESRTADQGATGSIAALNTTSDEGLRPAPVRAEEEVVVEETDAQVVEAAPAPAEDASAAAGTAAVSEESAAGTAGTSSLASAPTESAESAAAVIAMAQRLHDEYVAQGQAEKARLIEEGQLRHDSLIAEAEAKHAEVMQNLDTDKATLESDVEALRTFEAAYRAELRKHLETRITELENTPNLETVAAERPAQA